MFLSIYCSVMSCAEETDQSQCQKHTMESEYNYLSCFKIEASGDFNKCTPFFTSYGPQKAYNKFLSGYQKEQLSIYTLSYVGEEEVQAYDKDTYDKNDIIKMKSFPLTEEDKKIINNNNTCSYNSYARFVDPDNYIGEIKINVSDKNACYNVDRFEDLKDVMDCGYAIIKGKYNNKPFTFTNCYGILDKNVDGTFKQFYKGFYLKTFFQNYYKQAVQNFIDKVAPYTGAYDKSKKRQLETKEIQDFEMTVEDRYGNVVVYNKDGDIIGGDDEPIKFANSSGKNSLNFILLLGFILFLI